MTELRPPGTGRRGDVAAVARGGSVATVGAVVAAVGGVVLTAVVGGGLGATGAGLFFEAVAVFMIATSLAVMGADTTLLRTLSAARAQGRLRDLRPTLLVGVLPVLVVSSALTAVLWWAAPGLVTLVFRGHPSDDAARYLQGILPFLAVGVLATVLVQATRAFGGVLPFVAVQNVLLPVGRPLVIVAALLAGWSAVTIPVLWGGLFVPAVAVAAVVVWRQLARAEARITPATPPRRPLAELATSFWRFSLGRGAAAAIDLALVWSDVLLVGALRSTAEAGVYATASRFVTSGTLVLQAMRLAIAPRISALMSTGRRAEAGEIYRVATLWIVATSWPLYFALAAFGPALLRLFGTEFTAAAPALSILSVAMLLNLGTGNVGTVLLMAGRSSWLLANKSAALAANVSLNLLLIPRLGISGAAVAWGVAIAVDNLAAIAQVRFRLGLQGYGRFTLLVAVASAACFGAGGLAARAAFGTGLPVLAAYLVVAAAAYLAVLWRWRDGLDLPIALAAFRRPPPTPPPPDRSSPGP